MSHTTTLRSVKITDIEAVRQAIDFLVERSNGKLKISLIENAVPRMYYPDQYGKCDYVVKLGNSRYDIGLAKQADGTFALVYDAWQGDIRKQVGDPMNVTHKEADMAAACDVASLLNAYGVFAAQRQLYEQGYYDTKIEVNPEDNSYVLTASAY